MNSARPPNPISGARASQATHKPRTAVIACAVLEEEVTHLARGMEHLVGVDFLRQGLHNEPPRLRRELQTAIDAIESRVAPEAVVLVYGLCSRGTEGVHTRGATLVMARAHDCITHLLGSKERYARYVREHPGTYWYSPGWNAHHTPPGKERYERLYREYAEKYGHDHARFLMEEEQHWFKTYDRATFVHLTIGATDEGIAYTRACAEWLNWNFDLQEGDPALLRDLLDARWDNDRFIVLPPGQAFRMTADDRVVEPAPLQDRV